MFTSIVQLNHFDKNISFPENDLSDETESLFLNKPPT